jgi:hypothetical protein
MEITNSFLKKNLLTLDAVRLDEVNVEVVPNITISASRFLAAEVLFEPPAAKPAARPGWKAEGLVLRQFGCLKSTISAHFKLMRMRREKKTEK